MNKEQLEAAVKTLTEQLATMKFERDVAREKLMRVSERLARTRQPCVWKQLKTGGFVSGCGLDYPDATAFFCPNCGLPIEEETE